MDDFEVEVRDQYGNKWEGFGVTADELVAMAYAVRGTNPGLADALISANYSAQPVED